MKPGSSSEGSSRSVGTSPEKKEQGAKAATKTSGSADTTKKVETDSQKILKAADKNGDGFLQKTELPAKDQANFSKIDANKDNKISSSELSAALKAAKGK